MLDAGCARCGLDLSMVDFCKNGSLYLAMFRIRINLVRIRIQHFRLITNPDPGFWWPKIGKNLNLQLKKNLIFSWSKIAIYLSLALLRTSKLQEKPSAMKKRHPAFQNMKFLYFFLFLWVIFALPDPYSGSGSGFTDLIKFGSYTDPDPNP